MEELAGWTADIPRLVRHHAAMLTRELVERRPVFGPDDHRILVSALLDPLG